MWAINIGKPGSPSLKYALYDLSKGGYRFLFITADAQIRA
jgi:hypothetical protein